MVHAANPAIKTHMISLNIRIVLRMALLLLLTVCDAGAPRLRAQEQSTAPQKQQIKAAPRNNAARTVRLLRPRGW